MPIIHKTWSLSFELNLIGSTNDAGNILQLFTVNSDLSYGRDILSIWTQPNATSLNFTYEINKTEKFAYNTVEQTTGSPIMVKMNQNYDLLGDCYKYNIHINDEHVYSATNPLAEIFGNAELYASGPLNDPAPGFINHLEFKNELDGEIKLYLIWILIG